MPYLVCPRCGLLTYSAAAYARVDECPECRTPLILPARAQRARARRHADESRGQAAVALPAELLSRPGASAPAGAGLGDVD